MLGSPQLPPLILRVGIVESPLIISQALSMTRQTGEFCDAQSRLVNQTNGHTILLGASLHLAWCGL